LQRFSGLYKDFTPQGFPTVTARTIWWQVLSGTARFKRRNQLLSTATECLGGVNHPRHTRYQTID
jgi:hypothetical protein